MRDEIFALLFLTGFAGALAGKEPPKGAFNAVTGLKRYAGCVLVNQDWADGDSFRVRFVNGAERNFRLYAVDCIETRVAQDADAVRLRQQQRYFGLQKMKAEEVKEFGKEATRQTRNLLGKPFTIETAWKSARGRGSEARYYAYVTIGRDSDLGAMLVKEGLARASGIARARRPGVSRDEYKERLRDLELQAASKEGRGIWKATDWTALPEERRKERAEQSRLDALKDGKEEPELESINPNSADEEELDRLPGIGPTLAGRIIEEAVEEKFRKAEDLKRVKGIGSKTLEKFRKYLKFK